MIPQNSIDEKAALDALCGDRQLLRDLATMFVEDAPSLLQELKEATERRELETACRAIHSLRGLSSTFYSSNIVDLATRIEVELKNGSFEALCPDRYDELATTVECLIQELRLSGYVE